MATPVAGSFRHHLSLKFHPLLSFQKTVLPRALKFQTCPSPFPSSIRCHSGTTSAVNSNKHGDTDGNSSSSSFSWEDVFRISDSDQNDPHDLSGFFDKVRLNNRNADKQSEFMPFVVENHIVGYVHHGFAEHLRKFKDVFLFQEDNTYGSHFGCHVTLHPILRTPEDRTRAVGDVIKCLGNELIPGIRDELYPVAPSHAAPVLFSLERAAAPYFGIKAYGIHMNGFVEREGKKFLWVGKRSEQKPTYPGMLDHLAAGGLPYGISCEENVVKECEEEAGIPRSISIKAIPVGAVSYLDINGHRFKRDVLFCYDLKLEEGFVPKNEDGEVEGFKLIPVTQVANIIHMTHFYKANCTLVVMDFLFRHGYIRPESLGYLKLLQSLRTGDCS